MREKEQKKDPRKRLKQANGMYASQEVKLASKCVFRKR